MLKDITLGQYFPGTSFLHQLDPRCKIIATLIVIVAIFLAESLPAYGLITVFILLCFFISHLPLKLILKSLKPLWVIIILTMGIHVFTTSGTVIWQWGILHITWEGIRQGALMTARLIYLIVFSSLLTYTTSPIVLTDGIEHLLNPFRRVGVPAHELAMMMTIALRFIPTLLEETDRIMKAQTARGANFTSGSIMQRGRNMIPLLVPLFVSAFRRADDLATAMEARCYRGGEGRTRMHELAYTFRDTIAMIVVIGLTAVLVAMRWFI
ncbi:energy-coupling factor transporter transmembrane protein EcfT [Megasphaera sp. AM44-1BH]|jgi:energy-coupling factor transport system permease protein|uniref:energy-coupling factor transporter transmembrane component T family protein n=1 Tax=Megasphaera sp. AM44-1BH TaxID=2292358 RepID=UPI000E556308|nr:energy-coupling factor transporter transmembrane component T [Megasphaera sp. AM44-1BH]RHA15750.1 energy-coupling factor transporter transmembrane protein EcfT [Megasphaera sp. AM44-1BH]